MEKKRFTYKDRDEEAYNKRAVDKGYSKKDGFIKEGFNFFTPLEGKGNPPSKNKVRILPPTWDDPEHYGLDIYVHYSIGSDNNSYLCLNKTYGKPCPICEEILKHKDDKEYISTVGVKRQLLVWVIDRNAEKEGPKIWRMPINLDRSIVLKSRDEDTGEILRIDHPYKGYDIMFVRSGTTKNDTKYLADEIARKSTPLSSNDKLIDEWLEFIQDNPIPSILETKDYAYIKKVFEGAAVESSSDPEDDIPVEHGRKYEEVKGTGVESPKGIIKAVKEETKDIPTKREISKMTREELEEIAIDEIELKGRIVRAMEDDELEDTIIKFFYPEKDLSKEEKDETTKDKLEKIKAKYKK